MGTGLLVFVWVLQTVYLVMRIVAHLDMSFFTLSEYLLLFSWLLVTISLVMSRFFRIEFIVFFVNVIGFAVLALNLFGISEGTSLERWEVAKKLLYVHVSFMICAYAALTISAIFAGMYLFLHNRLKEKVWTQSVRRLPSLAVIDVWMYRSALVGTPLLALSLAVAVTSILTEGRYSLLLDPKVVASFIALALFIWTVLKRKVLDVPSWKTARMILLSYALLLLNVLMNQASSFHSWS
ncbi:HemX protein [Paenibacillus phyllosphaerae]|uniref:HemX protein n=2 Tax=Paenibacillus phyllosphaerae TaxID=274593 RepID=A0A7W5AW93_9BACL|nr:HemX protein [Paenibacillus phyllosphaerae]